jgi:L-galactose dehydrogenase
VVLSYGQFVLYDTSMVDLADDLRSSRRGLINASPLAMGLLSGREPPPWHPAPDSLRAACESASDFARSRGVTLPRLALRFAARAPAVTTLVGMHTPQQVDSNIEAFGDAALDRFIDELRLHMRWN